MFSLMVIGIVWAQSVEVIQADEATEGVAAATQAYQDTINSGDGARSAEFWAEDADYTTAAGETYRGRAAIKELMAVDKESAGAAKLKITDTTARALKPEVVIQDGTFEFQGGEGTTERSRYSAVWVKNDGKWQLSSVRDLGALPTVEVPQVRENPLLQLEALRGEWVGKSDTAELRLAADWGLGKQFLEFDYAVTPQEGEPFRVKQIMGWDPLDEMIRSWFFDSTGGHGSGLWEKTETGWQVVSTGVTATGQIGGGVYNYDLKENTLTLTITNREVSGTSLPDAVVKFTRK